ncbi:MAG: glycosyltransferase [Betaproteobacteria bacterium]|nr:glycosyltransferase [Betaproteobacteria bacterium]
MRIALITPYLARARNGNAHTAARWARCLRAGGHRVQVMVEWDGRAADLMIALHARRSAASIRRFAEARPDKPLIVVLTGTDLYRDIHDDAEARRSLDLATRLVVLQERGLDELTVELRSKTAVIYQSAPRAPSPTSPPLAGEHPEGHKRDMEALRAAPFYRHFDVCVVAHLREEKDPLRAAQASGLLPAESRIRVRHVGQALDPMWTAEAERCAQRFPRWHWLGPLAHGETRRAIARSQLLVNSSRMEGGAIVILEAVMAGVPVLASRIAGNEGMLGVDYAGYFPLGDEGALAALMRRCETDPAFYALLKQQCAARMNLFLPERECAAIEQLVNEAI